MSWWSFRPYISVAQRRANAAKEIAKMKSKGRVVTPVVLDGRTIAATFWGKAWCANLERYSDYESRLPRGRTYVRNGSVVDLQIMAGKVTALVSGSALYEVMIEIDAAPEAKWATVKKQCSGQIGSALELLQGKLSENVMRIITAEESGLFPLTRQIRFDCSCPDGAYMCKHIAAVLYGVGSRLDTHPELLFVLRKVDHLELIEGASFTATAPATPGLSATELADVFGIDIAPEVPAPVAAVRIAPPKAKKRTTAKGGKPKRASAKLSRRPARRKKRKAAIHQKRR